MVFALIAASPSLRRIVAARDSTVRGRVPARLRDATARRRVRGQLKTVICEWCKREFQEYSSRAGRFCSRKCAGCARSGQPFESGGRIDLNQGEIVNALRQAGASVLITNRVGRGFPDLAVGFRGRNILMEVKNGKNSYGRRGFNKNQQKFHDEWRGEPPVIVRSIDDALRVLGALV